MVNREGLRVAREEVVEEQRRNVEQMLGSEVEYKTENIRKKIEAVMVKLIKIAEELAVCSSE